MTVSNELFLLSCVNHSNNGKINWEAVGNECGMKKNAAFMRFKRFKEKHEASLFKSDEGNIAEDGDDDDSEAPKKPKTPVKKARRSAKKRKAEEEIVEEESEDEI